MEKKRVHIQNSGQPGWATKVTDAVTGEEIPNVTQVELSIQATGNMQAVITTFSPSVDILTDAEIRQVCPCCGRPVEKPAAIVVTPIEEAVTEPSN